ncbi:MAG: O-acetyl-ADP-ribose deacetylase [Candidatus Hydrogenedentes bacterium ADurb.Bin101]|nr:MAG: O-acetyl-ADP-ribose deacetylase [Candidatus Hydrogenedentes bacterium ADurb.Bin101]
MATRIHGTQVEAVQGDITREEVDAIVNAANKTLLGGGGVDGAIHRAGGPAILEACRNLNGCDTGDAKITTGGRLPATYVIHTVGPVYRDGNHGEPELLASCYRRSLEVALENGVKTVAFPAISCGVYGYPHKEAAAIAVDTVTTFVQENSGLALVRFVLFNGELFSIFEQALDIVA